MKRTHEAPAAEDIEKATEKVKRRGKGDGDPKKPNGAPDIEPPDEAATFAEIERLAKLSVIAYQRTREAAAKFLGFKQIGVLDRLVQAKRAEAVGGSKALPEIEPWHEPVDGAALLDELVAIFKRHVVMPTRGEDAAALWVLHTHCLEAADHTPRLVFTAAAPECGKTTSLKIVTDLVPRALKADGITAAATYRAIEKWHPTLVLDEADTYLPENEALRGVLDSGHERDGYFPRCVGDASNYDVVMFSTWCAMALALIGKMHPALESRAIHIELQRLSKSERVERYRRHKKPYADVARRCARWAADNVDNALRDAEPEMPEEIANRFADNWRAIFAIADRAGGHWAGSNGKAREAALTLNHVDAAQTIGVMLLADIRSVVVAELGDLAKPDDKAWIASKTVAQKLGEMEGRPWPEWKGKPITQNAIARRLKDFKVEPTDPRLLDPITGERGRGYWVSVLRAVFDRYLPSSPDTPPHNRAAVPNADAIDMEATFSNRAEGRPDTVAKMPSDAGAIGTSHGCTVVNPPSGKKGVSDTPQTAAPDAPSLMAVMPTALAWHGILVPSPVDGADIKAVGVGLLAGTFCGRRTDLDDEFARQLEFATDQGDVISGEINGTVMLWLPTRDDR
jgi:putative DNA primase/helicase